MLSLFIYFLLIKLLAFLTLFFFCFLKKFVLICSTIASNSISLFSLSIWIIALLLN